MILNRVICHVFLSSFDLLTYLVDFPDLCKKPVDGFSAGLVDESDVFEWSVSIMGPPDTL
jgi:hypothetical protein